MEKPTVINFITRFIRGGADDNVAKIIQGLNRQKYNVHLGFGNEFDRKSLQNLKQTQVSIFKRLKHLNVPDQFISFFQIYNFFKTNNFTILHTHSTEAGIICRIAAKLAGVPIIIHTVEGIPYSKTRPKYINLLTYLGERIATRFSNKIITLSDSMTEYYISKNIGNRSQYTTIYAGIDIQRIKNSVSNEKIRGKSRFNVIMIARKTEGKGYPDYFSAIRAIMRSNSDSFHFFSIGDGDQMQKYNKMSMDLSKVYTDLGYVSENSDVYAALKACDLLVLPSYREGTPKVIYEAMALGIPVIATNIAGIPEQVIDGITGFIIPVKNPKVLAERIVRIKNNPKMAARLGKEAQKYVQKFSAQKMISQIHTLYADQLKQKGLKTPVQ